MKKKFENLLLLSSERRAALEDQYNLHVFERESKDLESWILSRKALAESDDLGQDLEDVEATYLDKSLISITRTDCR